MRVPLPLAFVLALRCSPVTAAPPAAGNCDQYVGAWEYVEPSWPGRVLISKYGEKYAAVWILNAPDRKGPGKPSTEAEKAQAYSTALAVAADLTCRGQRATWRIAYSLDPTEVGAERQSEGEFEGDNIKFWIIGPDGKRGAPGAARRMK